MATKSKRTAKTYGELRKLLSEAGDPWQPDPTKADEELLPEFPTGGDGVYEPESRTIGKGGVDDLLKKATPPSNPDLRAEWREDGMLADGVSEAPRPARRSRKKQPSTTPAPDTGG
jgi:hypothetical protein